MGPILHLAVATYAYMPPRVVRQRDRYFQHKGAEGVMHVASPWT